MRVIICLLLATLSIHAADPFDKYGPLRVAASKTYLEHTDGTPFLLLADTCWTGPALSTDADWSKYLADRKAKGFTAIQFNMVSPWRTAPKDADGNASYSLDGGTLKFNDAFYKRLDARFKAINDAGLLAVPVLCWANKKGDAGVDLSEEHLVQLISFELARYKDAHALWILAGDNRYGKDDAEKWKRIGQAVFKPYPKALVTTHPTGKNFPWKDWDNETWLTVIAYQSGHGDDAATWKWLHSGPPAEYGKQDKFTRPLLNLEPPYEAHNGYQSKKPHSAENVRKALYWSLLSHPMCGVTYGGHGVWSWHTKPGEQPTDHPGTGVAQVWSEALDLPAAKQVKHLRAIFQSVEWWKLRPAQGLLVNQPGDADPAKFIAVGATPDRQLVVAYVPAGATLELKARKNETQTITWYYPVDGTTNNLEKQLNTTNDWVLVIQ